MGRPKKLVVRSLFTDGEMKEREGTFVSPEDIVHPIITSNTDVYRIDEEGKEVLLLKFRKRKINDTLLHVGWNSYRHLAKASRGRGASAGMISTDSPYWKKRTLVSTKKWSTSYLSPKGNEMKAQLETLTDEDLDRKCVEGAIADKTLTRDEKIILLVQKGGGVSNMKVNNQVASSPVGFYESSHIGRNLPCRLTHFTRTHYADFVAGLPFLQRIDTLFKELVPEAYQRQRSRADLKPHLTIPQTSFSSCTINRNFRTAIHRDAGDFKGGFGNLTVIERGSYSGGETVFPQFGVGFDLRSGDFVCMDVHQYHCNLPMRETEEQRVSNLSLPKEDLFHDNPEVGTAGLYVPYTRLSFVCYLREKIAACPDEKDIDPRYLTSSGHGAIETHDNKEAIETHDNKEAVEEVEED